MAENTVPVPWSVNKYIFLVEARWDYRCDQYVFCFRTVNMSLVSEFLGQLSLNVGVMSKVSSVFVTIPAVHSVGSWILWFHRALLCFADRTQVPHCGTRFGLWPRQRRYQNRDRYQNQRQGTVMCVCCCRWMLYVSQPHFKCVGHIGNSMSVFHWM